MWNSLWESRSLPFPAAWKPDAILSPKEWEICRKEMQDLICQWEYGIFPDKPDSIKAEILEENTNFCAGKALLQKIKLTAAFCGQSFSFPFTFVLPKREQPVPAVVFVNFRPNVPDEYLPSEEISDRGVAVASFWYHDVTSDDGDFSNGLAGCYYQGRPRAATDPGKIAFWAWAAVLVLDYLLTRSEILPDQIAVAGHSRLGKTALFAGAMESRFCAAYSNNSGCGGAALNRGKVGETIDRICGRFPYWFCENFQQFSGHEDQLPFDQHTLLALLAPRKLYVASAQEDQWADPLSEYLGCAAASCAWEALGLTGFASAERPPVPGDVFHKGDIGYHLRPGAHYLSRYDWNQFFDFMGWNL
ncbi:MAG: alpha/beta hydrolase family protein [Candidatus Merdivicinus sp.]|jgi:hypothetical protein